MFNEQRGREDYCIHSGHAALWGRDNKAAVPLSLAELVFSKFFCKQISIVSGLKSRASQASSTGDNQWRAVAQNECGISKAAPAISVSSLCAVPEGSASCARPPCTLWQVLQDTTQVLACPVPRAVLGFLCLSISAPGHTSPQCILGSVCSCEGAAICRWKEIPVLPALQVCQKAQALLASCL